MKEYDDINSYEQEKMAGLANARRLSSARPNNPYEEGGGKGGSTANSSKTDRREYIKKFIEKGKETETYLPKKMQGKIRDAREKYNDSKKLIGQGKILVKSVTPRGFVSLMAQINIFSDWPYGLALLAAVLKDIIDPILTALSAVTTVGVVTIGLTAVSIALGTIISILTSIFIAMMMLLGNIIQPKEHDRTVFQSTVLKRYGVLAVVFIIETFFLGINVIPVQTVGVVLIYFFALAERKGRKLMLNKAI